MATPVRTRDSRPLSQPAAADRQLLLEGLYNLRMRRLDEMSALERIEGTGNMTRPRRISYVTRSLQPRAFHHLGNLHRLKLSRCPLLRNVDASILKPLRQLEHLDLSFNQLSTLDEDAVEWSRLRSLD